MRALRSVQRSSVAATSFGCHGSRRLLRYKKVCGCLRNNEPVGLYILFLGITSAHICLSVSNLFRTRAVLLVIWRRWQCSHSITSLPRVAVYIPVVMSFRKIDIDAFDEDVLQEDELYDPDPRPPAQVLSDARQRQSAVRSALSKYVRPRLVFLLLSLTRQRI